jgi:hypothetical protein
LCGVFTIGNEPSYLAQIETENTCLPCYLILPILYFDRKLLKKASRASVERFELFVFPITHHKPCRSYNPPLIFVSSSAVKQAWITVSLGIDIHSPNMWLSGHMSVREEVSADAC